MNTCFFIVLFMKKLFLYTKASHNRNTDSKYLLKFQKFTKNLSEYSIK